MCDGISGIGSNAVLLIDLALEVWERVVVPRHVGVRAIATNAVVGKRVLGGEVSKGCTSETEAVAYRHAEIGGR